MPALSVLVASVAAPSMKTTVPVGVPAPGETAATVAVKVTDCPKTEGLKEDVIVVIVSALLTNWPAAEEVLVLKLLSPLYTAVIEWEPAANDVVVKLTCPELSVLVLSAVVPSLKIIVPVAVPEPGDTALTVAVNVTD